METSPSTVCASVTRSRTRSVADELSRRVCRREPDAAVRLDDPRGRPGRPSASPAPRAAGTRSLPVTSHPSSASGSRGRTVATELPLLDRVIRSWARKSARPSLRIDTALPVATRTWKTILFCASSLGGRPSATGWSAKPSPRATLSRRARSFFSSMPFWTPACRSRCTHLVRRDPRAVAFRREKRHGRLHPVRLTASPAFPRPGAAGRGGGSPCRRCLSPGSPARWPRRCPCAWQGPRRGARRAAPDRFGLMAAPKTSTPGSPPSGGSDLQDLRVLLHPRHRFHARQGERAERGDRGCSAAGLRGRGRA